MFIIILNHKNFNNFHWHCNLQIIELIFSINKGLFLALIVPFIARSSQILVELSIQPGHFQPGTYKTLHKGPIRTQNESSACWTPLVRTTSIIIGSPWAISPAFPLYANLGNRVRVPVNCKKNSSVQITKDSTH